jgi:thiol-disulfide isomerase/thioredoxin
MLPFITEIDGPEGLSNVLNNNPGLVIIKFGATWCGPCKKIESQVHFWMNGSPNNVQCCIIDIDDNFELYGFLKTKKMINGIPGIMCWKKNNVNYIPDDVVIGADPQEIDLFFQRCSKIIVSM